jgi:hypothetical protein
MVAYELGKLIQLTWTKKKPNVKPFHAKPYPVPYSQEK